MKYKKKPVIIDAVQWTGRNQREMFDFLTENTFKEEYMTVNGDHFYIDHNKVEGGLVIKTSEGDMNVSIGDYIIKEPFDKERMYYPCKEDIFHQTYETVGEPLKLKQYPQSINIAPIETEKVPYWTICSCNPANGGSGICGCVIANEMVDKNSNTNSNINTSTTTNFNTKEK